MLVLPFCLLCDHAGPVFQGANFRDLPGVKVGANNIVEWDPDVERVYLKSGKPLVQILLPNFPFEHLYVGTDFFCYIFQDVT